MRIHPLMKIFQTFSKGKELPGNSKEKTKLMEQLVKDKACSNYLDRIIDILYNPYRLFHYNPPLIVGGGDHTKWHNLERVDLEPLWDDFWKLLKQLEGMFGGNKARDLWMKFSSCSVVHRNGLEYWFACLIRKDSKEMIGWHQWDKYGFKIPKFCVQLCEVYNEKKHSVEGWIAEPKLDGLRGVILVSKDGVPAAYSRNGKVLYNCERVLEEVKKLGLENYALDGEFFTKDWSLSVSITKSQKPHPKRNKLRYWIFDILPLDSWKKRKCSSDLLERKDLLDKVVNRESGVVRIVPGQTITGKNLRKVMDKHLNHGFEGLVLKDPKSVYRFKRSEDWLKYKPVQEGDYEIVGVREGRGRLKGTLGALVIEINNQRCRVGSGFSDKDRKRLWVRRRELPGRIVQVEFGRETFEEGGVLRFPIFKRLREDKES